MNTPALFKTAKIASIVAISITVLAWITPNTYYKMAIDNEFIKELKKKLNSYNEAFSEERVYLHLDKPMYEPGEDIWFSAYLVNGKDMSPSKISDILHVELINPKGSVEKTINLIVKNGKTAGDFSITNEMLGGIYKIRAYTNWMKNTASENANDWEKNSFEKEIQVQKVILPKLKMKLDFERKAFGAGDEVIAKLILNTNENKALANYKIKFVANIDGKKILEKADITDEEGIKFIKFNLPKDLANNDGLLNVMIDYNGSTESVSRSIPIVLNKIDLALLPEGGELVAGLETNVAFKAINEFGKAADVEGVVLNSKNAVVSSFASFHNGMGAFKFTPSQTEKYTVKITKPEGITKHYEMPEVLGRGYVLNVENEKAGEITAKIKTTEQEQLSLVAQVRSQIYYSTAIDAKKGDNTIVISTANFPVGVTQLTLFDSKGIERAERLVFTNPYKQLSISIETDKEKYLPREKVKMTVKVKDEKGMPAPANLSLSIVNDQFLTFADDKSGNMLSQLLLENDLNVKVEEPAFYFDKKEEKASKALDYLLMTSGWRRFTWEKIMSNDKPLITYQNEKAVIKGIVLDAETAKPLKGVRIQIGVTTDITTGESGTFNLENIDLVSPVNINCSAKGYNSQYTYINDYNNNLTIYLYKPYTYKHQYSRTKTRNKMGAIPMAAGAGQGGNKKFKEEEVFMDGDIMINEDAVPAMAAVANAEFNNVPKVEGKKAEEKADKIVMNNVKADLNAGLFAGEAMDELVMDDRMNVFGMNAKGPMKNQMVPQAPKYYRGRQYYTPEYRGDENVEVRTDFRNTIYWNADLNIDYTGKKTIEFYMSDDISSFRTTVEGISKEGTIGRNEKTFFTQLPFGMSTKIPVEVATQDLVSIPLTLSNNTDKPLGGQLSIFAPEALTALEKTPELQTIMPGKSKTIYLDYRVSDKIGEGEFTIKFKACGLGDAFVQKIKIAAKGFPASASFSAQDVEKEFSFSMRNVVKGSLKASFTAFPNVVSDLMKGVEGILREPYGCFEQTSMSSYPNAMVLDYLKTTDNKDDKTMAKATDLLNRGYKRLITYETKEKGYEWFGSNPGHEALSAYGLMQFNDMKNVGGDVDQKMIDRTAEWLMGRKDGNGGFQRNQLALDNFGRASKEITDAYIVYSLSEAGYTNIKKEFETSYTNAISSKDPYMLALIACAAHNLKETKKANEALTALIKQQQADGSFIGKTHSITYSQGQSLLIETTALATMAMLKEEGKNGTELTKSVDYLVKSRNGYGTFGNTQGTVLALKALTAYAKSSKKTTEDGTIVLFIDGKKVAERDYKAGQKEAIVIEELEKNILDEGKHMVKVKFVGVKTPLPYSVAVNWTTNLPESNSECAVSLKSNLESKSVTVGETVRLTSVLTNKQNQGLPSTMAIIGIPAGFTAQPWQLKELQDKKVIDYYEIKGNNIAVYYRCLAPNAVKEIKLDLKAEMPGEYDAPASCAYLYYTNEYKVWAGAEKITVKKG